MAERKQIRLTQKQLLQTFQGQNVRLEEINSRLNNIFMGLQEIATATDALVQLQKAKENEKMLVPLGAGLFLHATVQDNKNILFSMAGGVIKTRKNESVIADLEKRKIGLEKTLEKTRKEQAVLSENVNTLAQVIRQGQDLKQQKK